MKCFEDISQNMQKHVTELSLRPTTINSLRCVAEQTGRPGRPPFHIQPEMLEDLLGLGLSKQKIAKLLGISRWTIYRRVRDYDLHHLSEFSDLSDAELDEEITDYINRHGRTINGLSLFLLTGSINGLSPFTWSTNTKKKSL